MSDAFKEISEHLGFVCKYARSIARGTGIDPEELASDCILRALQRFNQYKPGTGIKFWLKSICRSVLINSIRRASVERRYRQRAQLEREAGHHGPEKPLEVSDAIREALGRLPEEQASVVLLLALGYTQKEAAERLGIPEGTVSSRLYRAKEKLRGLYEGKAV